MPIGVGEAVPEVGGPPPPPLPNAGWSADVDSAGNKGFYPTHSLGSQTLALREVQRFDLSSIVFGPSEEVLQATFGGNIGYVTGNLGAQTWNVLSYNTSGDETDPETDTGANMFSRCSGGHALTDAPVTDFRTTGAKSIALNAAALTDINDCINTGSKKYAIAIKMTSEATPDSFAAIDGWNQPSPPTLTLVIGVPASNLQPVANAGPDQIVNEGDTVTLDGTASYDIDGTIASYEWGQIGDQTVTLSSTTVAQPTFTAPQVLTQTLLTFALIVTDNLGAQGGDTVNITVNDVPESTPQPLAPIADCGRDRNAVIGQQFQLDGTASQIVDSGAPFATLQYSWQQIAGPNVSIDNATADKPIIYVFPNLIPPFVIVFSLTVFDGQLTSAPDTIDINVVTSIVPSGAGGSSLLQFVSGQENVVEISHATEMDNRTPSFMKGS